RLHPRVLSLRRASSPRRGRLRRPAARRCRAHGRAGHLPAAARLRGADRGRDPHHRKWSRGDHPRDPEGPGRDRAPDAVPPRGRPLTMRTFPSRCFPLALALACSHAPETPVTTATPQQAFDALSKEYLDRSLPLWPTDATLLGDHQYDGRWPDVSKDGDAQRQRFDEEMLARLVAIPRASLSPDSQVDAAMLENSLRYSAFART